MTKKMMMKIRNEALEEAAEIAESYKRFANHNPHCMEIAEEIRSKQKVEIEKEYCNSNHWAQNPDGTWSHIRCICLGEKPKRRNK